MATNTTKPRIKRYHAATVGSFEKEYGIKLDTRSKNMRLSTYMTNSTVPSVGKLLKAVEEILSK